MNTVNNYQAINAAYFKEYLTPKISELMDIKKQLEELDTKHFAAGYAISQEDMDLYIKTHKQYQIIFDYIKLHRG